MRRVLLVAFAAASLVGAPAAGAANCGTAVLKDWADGKLDRAYPVRCYQDALDAMPEDMRSYTSAPDDIKRALLARVRATRMHHGALHDRPRHVTAGTTGIPLPLIVIAAIGLVLLLAGSTGVLGRRFRAARHSRT